MQLQPGDAVLLNALDSTRHVSLSRGGQPPQQQQPHAQRKDHPMADLDSTQPQPPQPPQPQARVVQAAEAEEGHRQKR
jgi:hypothetical protein